MKFMFRHLQPYFNEPIEELMAEPAFKGLFDLQRIGTLRPNAPVLVNSNRFDPPWCRGRRPIRWPGTGVRRVPMWSSVPMSSRRF